MDRLESLRHRVHRNLVDLLQKQGHLEKPRDLEHLRREARILAGNILETLQPHIGNPEPQEGIERESLIKEVVDQALGLGPLEDLLHDPEISEVMVNGPSQVYIERHGKVTRTPITFASAQEVISLVERIVSPLGRRIDESSPMVDARLPDGSRINAIIPPISLIGPCLTIRRFRDIAFTPEDFLRNGTLTDETLHFLQVCVEGRLNILISGGTGTGKTTLLNLLARFIPTHERIVTIEDAAELRLPQDHVISLEARPANIEGQGEITIRSLVRNALRMRPDRIVVGECRGGEALDMLQAMNTGHDGSLTTGHANDTRDMLLRLETMVLMSGLDLPLRAVREQIASAIDLIVQLKRFGDGTRRVVRMSEICGMEREVITTQDLFVFQTEPNYQLVPTGLIPHFRDKLKAQNLDLPCALFQRKGGVL